MSTIIVEKFQYLCKWIHYLFPTNGDFFKEFIQSLSTVNSNNLAMQLLIHVLHEYTDKSSILN